MVKNTFKIYPFFVFICSIFLFSQLSFAQRIGNTTEKWFINSTPHFEIFYSAKHQDLGLYYAKIAELSYAEITTVFTVVPTEKIVVIINDSTDASNGFTTLIPYPYIMIYPVQVGKDEVLSEAAEWAKELFIHELTHVFQLYPAEGYFKFVKPVFGTIVAPNLLMPLWWKEGMAVEIETQFTEQGRTRSYFQDASLRALVLENKLFKYTLAEANEVLPSWPYGGRPYLFGSMLMGQIAADGKPAALSQITNAQGERLPYFIEKPHQDIYGKNYESHYLDTLTLYNQQANDQIQKINSVSTTVTTPIDSTLISSRHPRFDAQGTTLAFMALDKKGKQINFYRKTDSPIQGSQWQKLTFKKSPKGDISSFEFHPKDLKIIFAKLDQFDSKNMFSDLYVFDLNEDKEDRLTKGARARNPIWSLDDSFVYFVSTFNGKTQLKSLNLKTSMEEQLFETPFTDRIHEISILNASELLVSVKNQKGIITPYVYDLTDRKIRPYEINLSQIEHFKIRNNTAYVTSTENGVANIYQQKNKKNIPLTNFSTGTLEFDLAANNDQTGVAAIFTSNGTQVVEFQTQEFKELPKISNKIKERYNYISAAPPTFESTEEDAKSLKYLYPHYWIPFVSTSTTNQDLFFQIITSGQDPLLIHRYNLSLEYDTYIKKMGYNLDYVNSALNWPIDVVAKRNFKPIGNTRVFIDRSLTSIGVLPDTFSISPKLITNAGLQSSVVSDNTLKTNHVGLYFQLAYKATKQTLFDIYPTTGWSAFLRYESNKTQESNLSDFYGDYDQAIGSLNGYSSFLLPEDHSMFAKLSFLHTFQNVSARFGTSNSIFPMLSDSLLPEFVLRGYSLGQFFGSRLVTLNTEYRFPITTLNKGSGTDPYFLKRINGAIIADGLVVRGGGFDKNDVAHLENMTNQYWSAGAELRLETTLGYLLPVNFIAGFYHPFSPQYAGSSQMALSLQIGGNLTGGRADINH